MNQQEPDQTDAGVFGGQDQGCFEAALPLVDVGSGLEEKFGNVVIVVDDCRRQCRVAEVAEDVEVNLGPQICKSIFDVTHHHPSFRYKISTFIFTTVGSTDLSKIKLGAC